MIGAELHLNGRVDAGAKGSTSSMGIRGGLVVFFGDADCRFFTKNPLPPASEYDAD